MRLTSRGLARSEDGHARCMAKHEKVPGMKEIKPNREQRRHPEQLERPENEPLAADVQPAQPDVQDPRAKSSGHRKKTADKWNQ